jgi:translocation and assembly module TamB
MKALRITLGVVGILLFVLVATAILALSTETGTQSLVQLVSERLMPALSVGRVEGSLVRELRIRDLTYAPPDSTVRVQLDAADVQLAFLDLFRGVLHIERASLAGLDLVLSSGAEQETPPPESQRPLEPPIDVVIDAFTLADAVIRAPDAAEPMAEIRAATLAGSWTDAGLQVRQFDLEAEQGSVHVAGTVHRAEPWSVDSRGRFDWTVGQNTYAGTIEIGTEGESTQGTVSLTAPVAARIDASVVSAPALEWQLDIEVPAFDPGPVLPAASRFESISASIEGSGTRDRAQLYGQIGLDGVPLAIESLEIARTETGIALDALRVRIDDRPATLEAQGSIDTQVEPASARLALTWQTLELPETWVGQTLHTRGEIRFAGSSADFTVDGHLAAGPGPQRLTEIELELGGSTERLAIDQLDIVQDSGRFSARGRLDVAPQLAWNIEAEASSFDPGELLAAWPGNLDLHLTTQGELTESGPRADVDLDALDGELRGRPISGQADLVVTPPKLSGRLTLRSGDSTIAVEGRPGDALDADVRLEIDSLNDWLPAASGSIAGDFHLAGTWKALQLSGTASANALELAGVRIATTTLDADFDRLDPPAGSLQVDARDLEAAGFAFDTVDVTVESAGDDSHAIELAASGDRLNAGLAMVASRTPERIEGSIEKLVLDVIDVDELELEKPAQFAIATAALELERACLDGRQDVRLCVGFASGPGRVASTDFELSAVPLELANVFAPGVLPGELEGTVDAQGELARARNGRLSGHARIRSDSATLHFLAEDMEAGEPGSSLLLYEDLELTASLDGERATSRIAAAFGGDGRLEGSIELADIGQGSANTSINGSVNANLPTLDALAPFVPRLTDLTGTVDAQIRAAGTLATPELDGHVTAAELGVSVPDLGIDLHDGSVRLSPRAAGGFDVDGSIASGKGRIAFAGVADPAGTTQIAINGRRFEAVDLPAGEVVIAPDLVLTRNQDRLELTGRVEIPKADINIRKLPQGRPQQISDDVVIVDADIPEERKEETGLPIHAEIEVALGDQVEIEGYGLEAQLGGELTVTDRPGRATLGSGTITVSGQYKAYGQDLTVSQGQLLFAGTPIDNPRLNIEAVREIDDIMAGLRITGTARAPEVAVFSNPALGDGDALSYLVAGRPLNDIGAGSDEENDALKSATRSLSGAAGGLLAERLGHRLGIDEATVEDNEAIGGAAFTLGEYLSPKLYLGYGVGLFDPGEVITIRYLLDDQWTVEVLTGSRDTRTGVEYEVER